MVIVVKKNFRTFSTGHLLLSIGTVPKKVKIFGEVILLSG
jgi:hypothetical protein